MVVETRHRQGAIETCLVFTDEEQRRYVQKRLRLGL